MPPPQRGVPELTVGRRMTVSDPIDLIEDAFGKGAHGMTLEAGEFPIVYWGKIKEERIEPSRHHSEIEALFSHIANSRARIALRRDGVTRFFYKFSDSITLICGATTRENSIRLELRVMANKTVRGKDGSAIPIH